MSIEQVTYKILLGMAVADLLVRISGLSQIVACTVCVIKPYCVYTPSFLLIKNYYRWNYCENFF